MFYDIFMSLCKSRGKVPTAVLTELGMSKGNLGKWKGGRTPKTDALLKIANYFDVSIDYLTGNDQKEKPVEDDEPQTLEEAREILRQSGIRVLLDAEGDDFTPEEIKEIMNFIKFKHEQRGKQS